MPTSSGIQSAAKRAAEVSAQSSFFNPSLRSWTAFAGFHFPFFGAPLCKVFFTCKPAAHSVSSLPLHYHHVQSVYSPRSRCMHHVIKRICTIEGACYGQPRAAINIAPRTALQLRPAAQHAIPLPPLCGVEVPQAANKFTRGLAI